MDILNILLNILSSPLGMVLAVLFLAATIFVHELGHFLAARWRGLVIERFSIFFGPKIFGWKRNGVEYRVGWIPLGGYVALPQMADMRAVEGDTDNARANLPAISYTDKVIVAAAGAFFNILFALALATVLWITGFPQPKGGNEALVGYVPEQAMTQNGETIQTPASRAGLRPGDRILAVDGTPVDDWTAMSLAIAGSTGATKDGDPLIILTVSSGGEVRDVPVKPYLEADEGLRRIGIGSASTIVVADFFENAPAERAGLREGDQIVAINGERLYSTLQLVKYLQSRAPQTYELTIQRDSGDSTHPEILTLQVPTEKPVNRGEDAVPVFGIAAFKQEIEYIHANPIAQIEEVLMITWRTLYALIHPEGDVRLRNLSGPIGITHVLYQATQAGPLFVLYIMIIINVNLAFLNLLPLPILDGGHILLATIKKLTGSSPPEWLITGLQAGMAVLLLGLAAYIMVFDSKRVYREESRALEAKRAQEAPPPPPPVFEAPRP